MSKFIDRLKKVSDGKEDLPNRFLGIENIAYLKQESVDLYNACANCGDDFGGPKVYNNGCRYLDGTKCEGASLISINKRRQEGY